MPPSPAGRSPTWSWRRSRTDQPPFRVPTSPWVRAYLADKLVDVDGTAVQTLARTWVGAAVPTA